MPLQKGQMNGMTPGHYPRQRVKKRRVCQAHHLLDWSWVEFDHDADMQGVDCFGHLGERVGVVRLEPSMELKDFLLREPGPA